MLGLLSTFRVHCSPQSFQDFQDGAVKPFLYQPALVPGSWTPVGIQPLVYAESHFPGWITVAGLCCFPLSPSRESLDTLPNCCPHEILIPQICCTSVYGICICDLYRERIFHLQEPGWSGLAKPSPSPRTSDTWTSFLPEQELHCPRHWGDRCY